MNKSKTIEKLRTLALKKETIAALVPDQLKHVAGGNTSSTRLSQCPTLCFTA